MKSGLIIINAILFYLNDKIVHHYLNDKIWPLDVLSDHCILPSMVYLPHHIFGCVIYVHLHPHQPEE